MWMIWLRMKTMRTLIPAIIWASVSEMMIFITDLQAMRMGIRERDIDWFSIDDAMEVNLLYNAYSFLG